MHLVDTSVLTRLDNPMVREVLEPLVELGSASRVAITDLEIGYSARDADEWERLAGALEVFPLVEISSENFARALQVQRMLAARRLRGRKVPDLLIAAAAEAQGLNVLHYDADFDVIASVTGQSAEWVVERGRIS